MKNRFLGAGISRQNVESDSFSHINITFPNGVHMEQIQLGNIVSENVRLSRILHDPDYIPSMSEAPKFSEIEQGKIAEKIRRSRSSVDNFLKDPDGHNRVYAGGRPKAISERDERVIVRAVKKSRCSSVSKIKASAGVGASTSIVRGVILNCGLHLKKRLGHPLLSPSHKAVRLELTRKHQGSVL
ncbi:Transposable element Tc3 transposase [Octopus vulgaris]|uniref:Transposable element Tc3 transposase n=1 Tax=Octopus vulgaris TaxID=6645 RepID=A0AA36AJ85_OCTVU|nr:Transposable element Tc3 transposase [Octopus vulgaris]